MLPAVLLGVACALSAMFSATAASTAAIPPSLRASATNPLPTPQFRRYDVGDGLPGSTVYAVTQDKQGIMWFSAGVDLARYDGVDFQIFRHHSNDPASLPEGQVYSLCVDRDNRLWVGGFGSGLSRRESGVEGFLHWRHDPADSKSLSSDNVWSIAQTPDGDLWVATDAGLDRLLPDGRHFEHVSNPLGSNPAAGFGAVRALLAEPGGRLWIGSSQGVFVREADGSVHAVTIDPRVHALKVWRIQGGGDDVRIAVRGGLLRVGADRVARLYAPAQIPSIDVYSSTVDQAGHLWIATRNGLYLDDGGPHIHVIAGQPLLLGSLPGQQVWQSFCDSEGGLWFVMGDGGIAYLAPGWNQFTRFTHVPDDPHSLRGNATTSVLAASDGWLWVGEHGLVDKLDPTTGEVRHLISGLHGDVLDMAEDGRQRLWIASEAGVYRYADGKLAEVDLAAIGAAHPRRVSLGPDGRMYLVSIHDGLFRIDPDTLTVDPKPLASADDTGFVGNRLTPYNSLDWYADQERLMRWNAVQGKPEAIDGLSDEGYIYALEFTADGFWAARGKMFEHYRTESGKVIRDQLVKIPPNWPSMVLIAFHVDRLGRFWLFCKNGLWMFDPHQGELKSFGLRNGLVNGEVRGDSPTITADGTIYVASLGGVFGFQPDRMAIKPRPTQVVITGATVRHHGVIQELTIGTEPIRLAWNDRELRVEARLSSYVDPTANRYRFRLLGFDTDWVNTGNHGEREFAGLGAGTYRLEVMAAGADGDWSTLVTPLQLHVDAPPWARWWAWLGYVLLVAAVVGLALRSWRRRLAQRHQIQLAEQQRQMAEAASAAKTQFLATLSHEIRTPMTGVMGMAELLLSTPLDPLQHDYTRAMQRSGTMLLKLLNDALDLARIEAGKLELEPAPFSPRQLLEDVAQLEQGLAHARGIRFVLEVADDLPAQVVGDAVRIKQVLLNLANNALKFTERGHVTLRGERIADGLLFGVSDTGPGIPEASQARLFQRFEQADGPQRQAGSGLGLAICRELVDMMGGSIELESRVGHGSTFRVRLPLVEPAKPAPLPAPAADGRRYHLLLVEDDTIVAAVIRGLLEREGHQVVHVINGLAALAELAHASFDAVLLDLDLPGVDGFQIARLIRQREPDGRHLPIIAVTARSGGRDEARAREAGMDGFLRKPVSGEQLAGALARVLTSASDATA
ncbi:hybrid sensor histidine kinase/response regulator [Rhodanobacter lindaniclasticus]|uniref:histidine kinase n=1 Tax=Rhodanobacter lindaniclasticus TaxID=75310 RepID=A0A4S3KHV7_9GAMM|nr:hybrid sensor histidine kinase/response regulator [Rhodanobacter lindaniclasticus]THD08305.1 hybrid sensor histidine kinase/response regulator [Rhodanobacter lindaniclasticus]